MVVGSLRSSDTVGDHAPVGRLLAVCLPALVGSAWLYAAAGRRGRDPGRPPATGVEYGVALGLLYGVSSLAIKGVSGRVGAHDPGGPVSELLRSPYPYLLVGTGVAGLVSSQTALQRCRASLIVPVCTTVSALFTAVLGSVAFAEAPPHDPLRLALRVAGAVLVGAVLLVLPRHDRVPVPEEESPDGTRQSAAADPGLPVGQGAVDPADPRGRAVQPEVAPALSDPGGHPAVAAVLRRPGLRRRARADHSPERAVTLAARLGPRVPPKLVTTAVDVLYPRFEPELRRLADFVPAGGTAVDVGGWYGPWSRRLARRADRVVTVEPVPHLARLLAEGAPANVRVVAAAAGDRAAETVALWLPPGDRGDRGVSSLVRREIHDRALEVPCVRLDDLGLTEVVFVKIDVDGSESAVLRGAEKVLRRDHPALFIEVETRIGSPAPVLDLLAELGYAGWVLPGRQWLPLAGFDLSGHQSRTAHVAERGLLRRSLAPFSRRYVNSVLFLPKPRRPGDD
ncbi:hypothetical protein B4N89_34425 [Embleya scabrispora]|uniref:Methyltransferase FkbM domain-containing protein n=1 Tax=Embleya scabrispora TaxID=159449 RepID=A0A1T3NRY2_9ACTN|nr:hypothetical protein B4N89_34425 [Embleya scabrispora]